MHYAGHDGIWFNCDLRVLVKRYVVGVEANTRSDILCMFEAYEAASPTFLRLDVLVGSG